VKNQGQYHTMTITVTINLDGENPAVTVSRQPARKEARPNALIEAPGYTPEAAAQAVAPVVKVATEAPAPIPAEERADAPKCKPGSGPQFDPGFLAIVRSLPEPFTRRRLRP
jgi:hypothetical protein